MTNDTLEKSFLRNRKNAIHICLSNTNKSISLCPAFTIQIKERKEIPAIENPHRMNKRAPDSIENPSQAFLSTLDVKSTLACLIYEKRELSLKDRKTKTRDIDPYIHSFQSIHICLSNTNKSISLLK